MLLIERLRKDALQARKQKSPSASLLVTLLGEIETRTKTFDPPREMQDVEVLAVIKKFLKGVDETLVHVKDGPARAASLSEKTVLESYLPTQMTEQDIAAFVAPKIAAGSDLGAVMGALKAEKAGLYDGRLASVTVKAMMSARSAA